MHPKLNRRIQNIKHLPKHAFLRLKLIKNMLLHVSTACFSGSACILLQAMLVPSSTPDRHQQFQLCKQNLLPVAETVQLV